MNYKNSDVIIAVNEYIHSERDRKIIIDRLVNGLTFSELSDKYYLTERQIKNIVKKADVILISLYK